MAQMGAGNSRNKTRADRFPMYFYNKVSHRADSITNTDTSNNSCLATIDYDSISTIEISLTNSTVRLASLA